MRTLLFYSAVVIVPALLAYDAGIFMPLHPPQSAGRQPISPSITTNHFGTNHFYSPGPGRFGQMPLLPPPQAPQFRMPILRPKPGTNYTMKIIGPHPGTNYTMQILPKDWSPRPMTNSFPFFNRPKR